MKSFDSGGDHRLIRRLSVYDHNIPRQPLDLTAFMPPCASHCEEAPPCGILITMTSAPERLGTVVVHASRMMVFPDRLSGTNSTTSRLLQTARSLRKPVRVHSNSEMNGCLVLMRLAYMNLTR